MTTDFGFRFRRVRRVGAAAFAFLVLLASARPLASAAGAGDALWRVVHNLCVPDSRLAGAAAPCTKVDLGRGYAIIGDLQHPTQVLLVPTARITGIEDPKLIEPGAPNYWALAWDNRDLVERRVGRSLARADVGLVVNSVYGRTQNQLHIHLDCLRTDVAQDLATHIHWVGETWRPLDVDLAGRRYWARWLPGADLSAKDPFKLLAELPSARADMGRQTLVMVGAVSPEGEAGFILLDHSADSASADRAEGEELLDHSCSG
jgi:CDP-diacylglycerol pyrophosphatase